MGFGMRKRTLPTNMSGAVVPEADKEPVIAESSIRRIHITFKDNGGREIRFRIKRDSPLSRLTSAYCEVFQFIPTRYSTVRFIYKGTRIKPEDTSDELGIEDGDEIDAVFEQTIGG